MKKILVFVLGLACLPAWGQVPSRLEVARILESSDWAESLKRGDLDNLSGEILTDLRILKEEAQASGDPNLTKRYSCASEYCRLIQAQSDVSDGCRLLQLGLCLYDNEYWTQAQYYLDEAVLSEQLDNSAQRFAVCGSADIDLFLGKSDSAESKVDRVLAENPNYSYAIRIKAKLRALPESVGTGARMNSPSVLLLAKPSNL